MKFCRGFWVAETYLEARPSNKLIHLPLNLYDNQNISWENYKNCCVVPPWLLINKTPCKTELLWLARAWLLWYTGEHLDTISGWYNYTEVILSHRDITFTQRWSFHTEILLSHRSDPFTQRWSFHTEVILSQRGDPITQRLNFHT